MKNLLNFILKYSSFFIFIGFQILCFGFLFSSVNSYHHVSFANSSNVITGGVYSASSSVSSYFHLKKENEQLMLQNIELKKRLVGHEIKVGELFTRVNDTLYFQQYDFLEARVISSTRKSRKNTLTINRGTENNVTSEMGVVGPKGVVGITISSSGYYSSVRPIIHEDFKLEIVHEASNSFGFVSWDKSDDWRTATIIDVPNYVEVKTGERILTRGSNGLFPFGELVGYVISSSDIPGSVYQEIKIELAEDFSNVYNVQVVKNVLKTEQDNLENNLK